MRRQDKSRDVEAWQQSALMSEAKKTTLALPKWKFYLSLLTGPQTFHSESYITTNHVSGGCCGTCEQPWGAPCPSQGQQSLHGNGKQGPRGSAWPSAWESSHGLEILGPESLGLVQFSKLKWLNWRTSKLSLIYFFSFPLTTHTNTLRLTFFHIQFSLPFPEKPSLHLCTAAEAARNRCRVQRGGIQAGHMAVTAWSPAWPSFLALMGGCWCLSTSLLTQREDGNDPVLGRHSQQRAAGWAQLSVRVWHCPTKLQFVIAWHNDMYDHTVLWKITTSSAAIRWDGKRIKLTNIINSINVLWVNCIYTYLGIDASISLHLYSLEFYYTFCNLLLKLLNRYSKLNLELMY